MPNIKSAKKRVLVTETKTMRNASQKSALKTSIKSFEEAVASGDAAKTAAAYNDAAGKLDKAVLSGIIHKNKAAHKKSQLAKKANAVK